MKIVQVLVKQEFLHQIHSFRFILLFVVTIMITVLLMIANIIDFKNKFERYEEDYIYSMQNNWKTYGEIAKTVVIKPNIFEIYSKGIDKVCDRTVISWRNLPEFQESAQIKNQYLDFFTKYDISKIIEFFLSLLTFLLVADVISREREWNTLGLIYSNRVSAMQLFISKYIACIITIIIPLISIFLISTIAILFQPFIDDLNTILLKSFVLFFTSLFFISIYIFITLSISSIFNSSSGSIITSLLVWILLVIIYPNSVRYIVSFSVPIQSEEQLQLQIQQIETSRMKIIVDYNKEELPSNLMHSIYKRDYGIPTLVGLTTTKTILAHEKQVEYLIPMWLEKQKEIQNLSESYRSSMKNQNKCISQFLVINPNYLFIKASSVFSNTDISNYEKLIEYVYQYRNQFLQYINSKDGFGIKFFTPLNKEDLKDKYSDYNEDMRNTYANIDNIPNLNLDDLPDSKFQPRNNIPFEFFILVLLNVLLFFIAMILVRKISIN